MEDLGVPFNFVSAADGTNVVAIFRETLDMAIKYKDDPNREDFFKEVEDLLQDGKWVWITYNIERQFSEWTSHWPRTCVCRCVWRLA